MRRSEASTPVTGSEKVTMIVESAGTGPAEGITLATVGGSVSRTAVARLTSST